MKPAFWVSFALAFLACLTAMGIAGGGLAWSLVRPVPERFATSAFSFDLPQGWSCQFTDESYECKAGKYPVNAIVIIALKERSAADNPDAYEAKLRGMPNDPNYKGARLVSLRRRFVLGSPWIEAVLMNSELPGYQTIYLAGTTSEIGILITLSVHERARAARMRELQSMVDTLVVNQRAFQ